MTDLEKLRAADEDDVLKALDCSYAKDDLRGIAPVALLEFFNCMLDALTVPRGEDD